MSKASLTSQRKPALSINTVLQRGDMKSNGHEAVSTAFRANGKAAEAACGSHAEATGLKPSVNEMVVNDWLVWQLVDSAFPTGGFAHSFGLEAAWQHGEIRNRDELILFLDASLEQLGHASLSFVTASFDSPEQLAEFDLLCDAFTTNHVANRASCLQGKAFLTAIERIFKSEIRNRKSEIQFAHFAPVFGACLRRLEIPRETALRMFFFNHLRGIFAAAVRLNIIGPMEAQMLQRQSSLKAETILKKCESLSLDDIAQTAPLLDSWQGAQNRLYSRLFQS